MKEQSSQRLSDPQAYREYLAWCRKMGIKPGDYKVWLRVNLGTQCNELSNAQMKLNG